MVEEKIIRKTDRGIYDSYKKVNYTVVDVNGVSVILFDDGNSMINDLYDAKRLGIKQIRIRNSDELRELIELRKWWV